MRIHQIDLHYHCGQERAPGKTLRDYFTFARMTGRRILGVTDHLELYMPPRNGGIYPASDAGLAQFWDEMDALRGEFSEMLFFFSPELHSGCELQKITGDMISLSDYFISEPPPYRGERPERMEKLTSALDRARAVADLTGKPVFLAHPFRAQLYHRYDTLVAGPPDYGGPESLSDGEVCDFMAMDLPAFARRAKALDIPVEVNGTTVFHAQCLNRPYYSGMLRRAYQILHRAGAELVPSSDQHLLSVGGGATPVPESLFDFLGIAAEDIPFLQKIGAAV